MLNIQDHLFSVKYLQQYIAILIQLNIYQLDLSQTDLSKTIDFNEIT